MKYYLIVESEVRFANEDDLESNSGVSLVRYGDSKNWKPPEGLAYVPDSPMPVAGQDYDADFENPVRELTAEAYGWKIVNIAPPSVQNHLTKLWGDLDDSARAAVYTHAPNVLLAWERGELEVMVQLILANDSPEISSLKSQVEEFLS